MRADKGPEAQMMDFQDPEMYRTILESLPIGIYIVDRDRRILFWNDAAEEITGYLRQDVVGRHCRDNILMHCDDEDSVLCGAACPLLETMNDGGIREAELSLRHQAGHRVAVLVRAVPLRDRSGAIIGAVESFNERGASATAERRCDALADHAGLNDRHARGDRGLAGSRLAESLVLFKEHGVPFCILLFQLKDLDHFQATYGIAAAEAILQVVARSLETSLRATDSIGRWNGRQFLAVLPGCSSGAEIAGKRLSRLGALSCIRWWGDPISVGITWGSTTAQMGDTVDPIVERASAALAGTSTHHAHLVMPRSK
jgi:PAS domain S-box-containing protein